MARDQDAARETLQQALQQWPTDPAGATETIRPLADEGDPDAVLLLAYMLMQQGRAPEGIAFAQQAVDAGAAFMGGNYVGQLMATPERAAGVEMLKKAQRLGYSVDPMGFVQQAAQAGDMDLAFDLLESARTTPPSLTLAEERFTALMGRIEAAETGVENSVAAVGQRATQATSKIDEAEAAIENERSRVQELVEQVSGLVHEVAAEHLAKEYSSQAQAMEESATRYTKAALLTGIFAIGAAVFAVVLIFRGDQNVGSVLGRFAFTLPLVVFGAYLGGLAASHRRMGWHWRHIELQIRTAEPFIAGLDDPDRKALLAVLALRFFPGQLLDPHGKSEEGQTTVDLSSLISDLLRRGQK